MNPLFLTDAYKLDHRRQYPEGTTKVYSNFTPRGSRIPGVDRVVFFGLQAVLSDLVERFETDFFGVARPKAVGSYHEMLVSVLGPEAAEVIGVEHVEELWDLGYLPLEFKALAEGTLVPMRIPVFTVENTHPDFFWLVNYFETFLSSELWLPMTSATQAHHLRELLDLWALKTTGSTEGVQWQAHDFSYRGMSDSRAAAASGAGHLLSFTGTDSIPSIAYLQQYYDASGLVGASVAATEHSVMCAGGEEDELQTFQRLLDLYPTGIVSVVSDTWDLWNVITNILPQIKDQVLAREGKLVIRPDSGDPVEILTGRLRGHYPIEDPTAADLGVIELLWNEFGGTINDQGYKVLDPHIGAIYGDSITYDRAEQIVTRLAAKGFASTNVVLGVGSYTYQYVTRDTFGFAMKATWVEVNGEGRNLQKDPVTDNGLKKSATGRLSVYRDLETGELKLTEKANKFQEDAGNLRPVWKNGEFVKRYTLDEIRGRLV